MTVETDISQSGPYAGAGTVGPFTVGFRFLDATHLRVVRADSLGEHVLAINTDYTVSGVGNPTGSVTLLVALPVGQTLTIIRDVPLTQEADYVQNDDFPAESHEDALDKLTMITQQLENELGRAITFPVSDGTGLNTEMPVIADRANKLLSFDALGNPVAVAPSSQSAAALQALLLTSAGSSLIGHDGTTLDQQLKFKVDRVVDTFAALRLLDKNKYTRAHVTGALAAGDGGQGDYYLDPADVTTVDDNWHTLVAADGGRWKRLRLVWQKTTKANDPAMAQFARNTNHTGGTPGFVVNTLNVSTVVNDPGVANFEWGFLAQMDNYATAGENVAVYAQAIKRSTGPTWAGCFEIQDKNGSDPAAGGALGIELACSANGGDTSFQRIGLHIAMGKNNAGGTTCEWGTGVYTGAGADSRYARAHYNDGPVRIAAFMNAADSSNGALAGNSTFKDAGKSTHGVDLSTATYTGSAVLLAAGQRISFDAGDVTRIRKSGANLAFEGSPAVFSGGRVQMNTGFGLPASGNTAASATAGSSGATPAQVAGYLIFQLDGSNFKIPYYGP